VNLLTYFTGTIIIAAAAAAADTGHPNLDWRARSGTVYCNRESINRKLTSARCSSMDSSVGAGRGSNSSVSVGLTQVYIPDKEFAWLAGEIVHGNNAADSGEIEVRITDEQYLSKEHATPQRKVDLSAHGLAMLPLQNNAEEAPDGVADLGSLSYLHEPAIMDTLRR
jgi:hypothetical protein